MFEITMEFLGNNITTDEFKQIKIMRVSKEILL